MLQSHSDLWTTPADARCITTNGSLVRVRARPPVYRGVMGRGVAWQAKQRFADIELALGGLVHKFGNHVHCLQQFAGVWYVSFPVKHEWQERADLDLITQSAYELVLLADTMHWSKVVLPRPGCGNGRLEWRDVEPVLLDRLDDRFTVVTL